MSAPTPTAATLDGTEHPWRALWALVIGFFMILVDSTIVSVATPTILEKLHTSINGVLWVTSAYLLAYAVPLLITGRLGDRFGPKRIYQVGLVLFTLSSAWCGLSDSIAVLVTARVFQGLGASMMTPQTMAVITRTFPRERRGAAMSLWGAVAGVATLVGPLLGGILVDSLGWQWMFFINVPVGVVGFVLALRLVPTLPTHSHSFDVLGIVLSAVGMFLLVFGIQEGDTYHWGTISGPISVWSLIIAGLVVLAVFLVWQARNRNEPLVPLGMFRDRNFSLANIGISAIGFAITAMALPFMLYAQTVLGMSPLRSALLMIPMSVLSMLLARPVGQLVDRVHPRLLVTFGMCCMIGSFVWLALIIGPNLSVLAIEFPVALMGLGSSFIWSPLSATATRNLPLHQAGAGAGVYNTTRQVGAVLGSAGIAVMMESRLGVNLHGYSGSAAQMSTGPLPLPLHAGFAAAMAESLYLPAAVLVLGLIAGLFFQNPHRTTGVTAAPPTPAAEPAPVEAA